MKRAKQKPVPAVGQSGYVVFLHPDGDIYKALKGDGLSDGGPLTCEKLFTGDLIRFSEMRILPSTPRINK